jgi:two-component system, chemotaxis family, protein-glutamate methylesterase/glutaminase
VNARNDLDGVVGFGASAGGVEALTRAAAGLNPSLRYAYLMVLHLPTRGTSILARIIDRSGPLPASNGADGTPLEPGHIYVCTPDRHLLVDDHQVMLSRGPTENGHRPAINALFRSIAVEFGPRGVGVLLSGVLDDGIAGLAMIRSRGGTTIGQLPGDALFPAMPTNAYKAGVLDHQATASEIGTLLTNLARQNIEYQHIEPDVAMELENRIAKAAPFSADFDTQDLGSPSGYTCPDCNGSLVSLSSESFRCRVGHAWSGNALLSARDDEIERALWVAQRSLLEKAKLARYMATTVGVASMLADRYTAQAEETERALTVLSRRLGVNVAPGGDGDDE